MVLYFKFVDGLKVSSIKYMYWGITSGLGVVGVLGILNMGPILHIMCFWISHQVVDFSC